VRQIGFAVRIEGDAATGYRLSGEMTYSTVPALVEKPIQFADTTKVSLRDVVRIDSAGLALLVEWTCLARGEGKTLVLEQVPESLRSLIEVSGLREVLAAENR
jgi:anti-anti-sigma factor